MPPFYYVLSRTTNIRKARKQLNGFNNFSIHSNYRTINFKRIYIPIHSLRMNKAVY